MNTGAELGEIFWQTQLKYSMGVEPL